MVPPGMTSEWTGRPKGNSIEMLPGLPPHSPNLNAFAERFVHTVKEECLERLVLVGEHSLFKALHEFEAHYMAEIRRRTRVVGSFPDGYSAMMLVGARLRHISTTKWGTRQYLACKMYKENVM